MFIIYTTISHVCITAIINPPWGSSLHTPHPPFLLLWQTFKMLTTDDVVDDVSHSHTHTHTQRVSCVGVWRYAPLWVVIATHTHSACVHVKTWCSMKEEEWNQLTVTPLYLLLITSLCSDLQFHLLWKLCLINDTSSIISEPSSGFIIAAAQSQLSHSSVWLWANLFIHFIIKAQIFNCLFLIINVCVFILIVLNWTQTQ